MALVGKGRFLGPITRATGIAVTLVVVFGPTGQVLSNTSPSTYPGPATPVGRGLEVNTSNLSGDQAEPFIAVAPRDPRRIVTTAIDFSGEDGAYGSRSRNIYVSSDSGRSWTGVESSLWADLTVVADHDGTFWVLGLGPNGAQGGGRDVTLVRIGPGTTAAVTTTLPRPPAGLARDKPLISIDNSVSSPTYGRLYAVWNEQGSNGYLGAFLTYCDTRVEGKNVPEQCDDAQNWATPFQIAQGGGWIWSPDVAIGPEGEVYVIWLDILKGYAIEGTSCVASCTNSTAFTSAEIIAHEVPVGQCAPAGPRVRQTPTLEVDASSGPNRGRVYVTWVAVRVTGVDCGESPYPSGPLDALVASEIGRLPDSTSGTIVLHVDGEKDSEGQAGAEVSDEFFPNIAVDKVTGKTWVSFYSTRLDESRKATNVYVRELTRKGDGMGLSSLTRVSSTIDLSAGDALGFYYGDYAGLDVVRGWPYPVWVGQGQDKDIYTWIRRRGATL